MDEKVYDKKENNISDNIDNKNKTRNPIKRLYNWVLGLADSKFGSIFLCINSFIEAFIFPIPPDVLQIALSVGNRKKSIYYAFLSTIFSILGAFIGYYIGSILWKSIGIKIVDFYHAWAVFESLKDKFNTHGFVAIFVAALTPIPYKVFTITAGVCKTNLTIFIISSILGRGLRFFTVGILIFIFGEKIKTFIDKYFNLVTIVFTILLIGAILLLGFIKK